MKRLILKVIFIGCSNGGGQIRGENSEERLRISNSVIESYSQLKMNAWNSAAELDEIFKEWFILNPNYTALLYTDYHSLSNKNILNPLQQW